MKEKNNTFRCFLFKIIVNKAYISIGSNRGNRRKYLESGILSLSDHNCSIIKLSSVYETQPWGFEDNILFLNQVLEIETRNSAFELLVTIKLIEKEHNRLHTPQYSGRTLDMDILFYNNEIINSDYLVVPHPHLHNRNFVLMPLNEIAPAFIHPVFGLAIKSLLDKCTDKCRIEKLSD